MSKTLLSSTGWWVQTIGMPSLSQFSPTSSNRRLWPGELLSDPEESPNDPGLLTSNLFSVEDVEAHPWGLILQAVEGDEDEDDEDEDDNDKDEEEDNDGAEEVLLDDVEIGSLCAEGIEGMWNGFTGEFDWSDDKLLFLLDNSLSEFSKLLQSGIGCVILWIQGVLAGVSIMSCGQKCWRRQDDWGGGCGLEGILCFLVHAWCWRPPEDVNPAKHPGWGQGRNRPPPFISKLWFWP